MFAKKEKFQINTLSLPLPVVAVVIVIPRNMLWPRHAAAAPPQDVMMIPAGRKTQNRGGGSNSKKSKQVENNNRHETWIHVSRAARIFRLHQALFWSSRLAHTGWAASEQQYLRCINRDLEVVRSRGRCPGKPGRRRSICEEVANPISIIDIVRKFVASPLVAKLATQLEKELRSDEG